MTPHDDALALQRQIAARAAFPDSRGMRAADCAVSWLTDGPRKVEKAIGSAFGLALMLVIFGRAMR